MENTLVRLLGWKATILHGDPTVADRWEWSRDHLQSGPFRTLEAGCGTGAFSLYAARRGNRVLGLSFNERNNQVATERARILGLTNVEFRQVDLRRLDEHVSSLGLFDQILCLETIEHLVEDLRLLGNLSVLLKPGGRLLLTTPFKDHHPLIGEYPDREYRSTVEDGGHVRFGYTEAELRDLFQKAGMEITRVDFLSGYISQKLYVLQCHLDRVLPHKIVWLATFPLRALRALDPWVSRRLRYPALSIAVIGQRQGMASNSA